MKPAAVEFRDIGMSFAGKVAVENINLTIEQGAFLVLLGPSGGGKTTLLNILGGFLTPTHGRVYIDGEDITALPPAQRPTTTVFQDYALFPHITVAGNVGFGLKMRGVAKAEQADRIAQALEMVGLGHMAKRRIHEMSGGQRQRIALARALVVEPAVLLLDEPLGALDMKLRRQMQEELKAIQQRVGTTFVHVTHDQEEAMAIADSIVVMNEGSIEDQGAPENIYLRPASRFSANFMGENNLIEGEIADVSDDKIQIETALGNLSLPGEGAQGAKLAIALRPEHLQLTPSEQRVHLGCGTVEDSSFFGTHHLCSVAVDGLAQDLRVRVPQKDHPQRGERLELYADPADMVLLYR